ncbi:MAG: glycoside hydrolase, partial [Actinomycetota bacterium]|nr:glycoside hydrolase [Actinomycetota bacterium]
MNESLDGVHYGSFCTAAGAACAGPPAVASPDEGIPGNIVVDNQPPNQGDPFVHRVYAIHTSGKGDAVIVSYCSGAQGDDTAAKIANSCTDPSQVAPGDPGHVNMYWHDSYVRKPGRYGTGYLFAAIAIDHSGNLYAVWAEYPSATNGGSANGPGVVKLSVSKDGAKTWSDPINVSPAKLGNNVMPWIVAGDAGRVDIVWYGAPQAKENGKYGPDTLDHGTWNVYMAQSLNALASKPTFKVTKVSDHQNKFGNISTQGLGGSPDRSLGDFMQVHAGRKGQAIISYVDDTSADRNPDFCGGCGQTPAEAAGPIMIAEQNRGPSLFKSVGTVHGRKRAVGHSRDRKGDAAFYGGGTSVDAGANLDLRGASIKMAT